MKSKMIQNIFNCYKGIMKTFFPLKQIKMLIILCCLTGVIRTINQRCSQSQASQNNDPCPSNSHCNSQGYCVCQRGYFGNCQNKGQYIDGSPKQFNISEKPSYFIIQPTLFDYVYYQFILYNSHSLQNSQLLNLWSDDGNMQSPNSKNALGIDKQLTVNQGYTSLMTPFFAFQNQPNQQKQLLIFGIRLKNPGSLKISLQVQQVELFGFDILFKILLVLIAGILLTTLGGVIYCVYKCRRRRNPRTILMEQRYDISHFDEYMPSKKIITNQSKQQICSVCLGQFRQTEEIRNTVCGHIFHKSCLDEWCVTNLSCPICRTTFDKANLIHHQYLNSRRQASQTNDQSFVEGEVIGAQSNLRKPII